MATNRNVQNPFYADPYESFLNDCSIVVENHLKTLTDTKEIYMYQVRNLLQDHADITPAFKTSWDLFYPDIIENVNELTDGFMDSMEQLVEGRN